MSGCRENFEVDIGWLEKITGVSKFVIGRIEGQLSPTLMKKSSERLATTKFSLAKEFGKSKEGEKSARQKQMQTLF